MVKKNGPGTGGSLTKHITMDLDGSECVKHIHTGIKLLLAPGYEQRENLEPDLGL